MTAQPVKDRQTVTPEFDPVAPRIDGLNLKYLRCLPDERGEICEVYRPAWGLSDEPLVYVYQAMVRPGVIKGWVCHQQQDDRIFVNLGSLRWVLFDGRSDSPTRGLVNDFTLSERNRGLFVIPAGVWHAVQNVGTTDGWFLNLPTRPYNHTDPDKLRLPLDNDLIPFKFT